MFESSMQGDRELLVSFGAFPARFYDRLRKLTLRLAIELQGYVKSNKLSGQVLKNRTGNLRASVGYQVDDGPDGLVARVGIFQGPTVGYGRVHEFGFSGSVNVKAHLRKMRDELRPVRAHVRQVNFPERSFLGSSLSERADYIVDAYADELAGAMGEA